MDRPAGSLFSTAARKLRSLQHVRRPTKRRGGASHAARRFDETATSGGPPSLEKRAAAVSREARQTRLIATDLVSV